jgi:type IX secretion system PorP/SprF family membrane protein
MRLIFRIIIFGLFCLINHTVWSQGLHFSQYYNAPLLINPANTALIPESDYRFGASHRMQWAALPAPFTTTSVYGDFQALRNRNQTNWLGFGFAFFNDRVGDGKLSLFRSEMSLAYHIQVGDVNMISFGLAASNGARSVNFSKFSYPVQWDGYTFNRTNPNLEGKGLEKSSYNSVSMGLNYAFFPNEAVYLKFGFSTSNLNKPTETFFDGGENTLQFRHNANIDLMLKTASNLIINPSGLYSTQNGSYEMLYGSLFLINLIKPTEQVGANQLILGAFHRWEDAIVGVVGLQMNALRFMTSYDYTISSLPINAGKGTGALEFSIRYEGFYGENSKGRSLYHCPRF